MEHPFSRYTREILSYKWPQVEAPSDGIDAVEGIDLDRSVQRILNAMERSGQKNLLLLGLGTGILASCLARKLPEHCRLTVACLDPERTRSLLSQGRLTWWTPQGNSQIIADNSPWAILYLLAHAGIAPGRCLPTLNPEETLDPRLKLIQRHAHHGVIRTYPLAQEHRQITLNSLSVAAILSPNEPRLNEFFAHIPHWVREVVVVWDSETIPQEIAADCAAPLRMKARPLNFDFASQRNAMLEGCNGDWILYLDGDERLPTQGWRALPTLIEQIVNNGFGPLDGFYFPRITLYPDPEHFRTGAGLWPDLQLRLFHNRPGLHFVNKVHEQLHGLEAPVGLLIEPAIEHLSHLYKTSAELEAKLRLFNKAGGPEGPEHKLNKEYPRLPRNFLEHLGNAPQEAFRAMTLPIQPLQRQSDQETI